MAGNGGDVLKIANIKLARGKFVIIAATVVAVASVYLVLYRPLMKRIKSMHSECRSLEAQVLEERNMIALAGKVVSGRVLMTERETSLAIDELAKHGKSIGINFVSMVPKEIVKTRFDEYKMLPVEMEIEATDQQFSSFMGSLDALQKSLIIVDSFDVFPNKDNPLKVKANIVINIYFSVKDTPQLK